MLDRLRSLPIAWWGVMAGAAAAGAALVPGNRLAAGAVGAGGVLVLALVLNSGLAHEGAHAADTTKPGSRPFRPDPTDRGVVENPDVIDVRGEEDDYNEAWRRVGSATAESPMRLLERAAMAKGNAMRGCTGCGR